MKIVLKHDLLFFHETQKQKFWKTSDNIVNENYNEKWSLTRFYRMTKMRRRRDDNKVNKW